MTADSTGRGPLRVMHVVDSMGHGGAQQVVVDLSNWLAVGQGLNVSVFGAGGDATARLTPPVRFIEHEGGGFLGRTRGLLRAAREARAQVLHAHQRREALQSLVVGRLLGIPVVEHAHTRLPSVRPRILSFRSRVVFAVGPAVAEMVVLDAGRPAERVVIVGNAPAQRAGAADPVANDVTSPLRLLALGRMAEQKNPLRFVRVVAHLAAQRPVEATWAGDGGLRDAARALASELGAPIDFPGQVDDVPARLDAAHFLVMTSRWEGTPLVLLEAFDRRRPVVATASAANGLLSDGRGFEVPDDAADAEFAAAIAGAADDAARRAAAVATAKRWADAEASPDRVFGPVLGAYRRLTGPAARS
ncbi:glycosyltransferase [Leifsonia shinshuensis]|uniref:Glycosyltransferase n=1 Tax=Leifsonia shinshuensis TaxID=150026 RepID=A0A7G6YA21_9MICO|nr:glycosyltransferase [Leifsonia shinshuensis]QNE35336.1 glycosyltransferase [Leifsonia shinshuensis]